MLKKPEENSILFKYISKENPITLYRAAKDDYIDTGYSFSEIEDVAKKYLNNPGFGGAKLFVTHVDPGYVADLRNIDTSKLAKLLGVSDPGAIGIDEWIPSDPDILDAIRTSGVNWVKVNESYPKDTTTWIWVGTGLDDEPVLVEKLSKNKMLKKEDMNYAARIADGMTSFSNKKPKLKNKYKFKTDCATLSGMSRSYYEENTLNNDDIVPVSNILSTFLEELETEKKSKVKEAKPKENMEEALDKTLLEDYKLIKLMAQKGINEVSNGHANKDIMNDILNIANHYKGDYSIGESGVADTNLTANTLTGPAYNEANQNDSPADAGVNNPT